MSEFFVGLHSLSWFEWGCLLLLAWLIKPTRLISITTHKTIEDWSNRSSNWHSLDKDAEENRRLP